MPYLKHKLPSGYHNVISYAPKFNRSYSHLRVAGLRSYRGGRSTRSYLSRNRYYRPKFIRQVNGYRKRYGGKRSYGKGIGKQHVSSSINNVKFCWSRRGRGIRRASRSFRRSIDASLSPISCICTEGFGTFQDQHGTVIGASYTHDYLHNGDLPVLLNYVQVNDPTQSATVSSTSGTGTSGAFGASAGQWLTIHSLTIKYNFQNESTMPNSLEVYEITPKRDIPMVYTNSNASSPSQFMLASMTNQLNVANSNMSIPTTTTVVNAITATYEWSSNLKQNYLFNYYYNVKKIKHFHFVAGGSVEWSYKFTPKKKWSPIQEVYAVPSSNTGTYAYHNVSVAFVFVIRSAKPASSGSGTSTTTAMSEAKLKWWVRRNYRCTLNRDMRTRYVLDNGSFGVTTMSSTAAYQLNNPLGVTNSEATN